MALHKSKLQSPVKKGLANENSFPVVKLKIEKRKTKNPRGTKATKAIGDTQADS